MSQSISKVPPTESANQPRERCRNTDLPCLVNIHVMGGIDPACDVCAAHLAQMRASGGYRQVGSFWLTDKISAFQSEAIVRDIIALEAGEAVPDLDGEFPACRPAPGDSVCERCSGSIFGCQNRACPAVPPEQRWSFRANEDPREKARLDAEVAALSPRQKAERIGIACGWVLANGGRIWSHPVKGYHRDVLGDLPDFLGDLNEMHDAELSLDRDDLRRFRHLLIDVVVAAGRGGAHSIVSATAEQRAEAFLRLLARRPGTAPGTQDPATGNGDSTH